MSVSGISGGASALSLLTSSASQAGGVSTAAGAKHGHKQAGGIPSQSSDSNSSSSNQTTTSTASNADGTITTTVFAADGSVQSRSTDGTPKADTRGGKSQTADAGPGLGTLIDIKA